MPAWTCPCGTENRAKATSCTECGSSHQGHTATGGGRCHVHAWASVEPSGFCPVGQGYVLGAKCPFPCPHCGLVLSWDGGCVACHGAPHQPRTSWCFPGDRYELLKDHWVKTQEGPRPAWTPRQAAAGHKILASVLGHRLPVADALKEIARIGEDTTM